MREKTEKERESEMENTRSRRSKSEGEERRVAGCAPRVAIVGLVTREACTGYFWEVNGPDYQVPAQVLRSVTVAVTRDRESSTRRFPFSFYRGEIRQLSDLSCSLLREHTRRRERAPPLPLFESPSARYPRNTGAYFETGASEQRE